MKKLHGCVYQDEIIDCHCIKMRWHFFERKDMNRLGTKAETLQQLYGKLKYAQVLPQYTFTVKEWKDNPEKVKDGFLALDSAEFSGWEI